MRKLNVYLNQKIIGCLAEIDDIWSFQYDPAWAKSSNAFDLSPELSRDELLHVDGSSKRTVQWYFDNLLPEETQRVMLGREAGIKGDDAFALLQYLGAESAGSLVLLPEDARPGATGGASPLLFDALSKRIEHLPRTSLSYGSPKRMSLAGAQNKLLVIYREGGLFEPQGMEPSTHIVKPEHGSPDYPSSVINEFAMMTLAARLGLRVPPVHRLYVPQPVYLVQRFDREILQSEGTQRRHIIDACQLLNKPRTYKYSAAGLDALATCIELCGNRARARLQMFQWLLFNVLIGNDDTHLKNLSFEVSESGIELSPAYDLLSTAVYHTRAYADEHALWPNLPMMIPLPGASTFGQVSRESLLQAGLVLGVSKATAERELQNMIRRLPSQLDAVIQAIAAANQVNPIAGGSQQAADLRLLQTIKHIVVRDTLDRLGVSAK